MQERMAIAYLRVSTARQGASGLGLEAQRRAVEDLCRSRGWQLVAEYQEVESGGRADRPQLALALGHARDLGEVLVVAKLDRLSRNVAFLSALLDSGAEVAFADMPEADRFTVHILAAVAEKERAAASERTRAALAAAKAKGTRLGSPCPERGARAGATATKARGDAWAREVAPVLLHVMAELPDASMARIAQELECRRVPTARGGRWTSGVVSRLLRRLELAA